MMLHQPIHDAAVSRDVDRRVAALRPQIEEAWARGDKEVLIVARIATPKRVGAGQMKDTRTDGVFIGRSGSDRGSVFSRYIDRGSEVSIDKSPVAPASPSDLRKRERLLEHYDIEEFYRWETVPSSAMIQQGSSPATPAPPSPCP